jgi:hypothetical protein
MRKAARIDSNQPEIVAALRKAGAVVFHVHTIKNLFDLLVFYKGNVYCVEVKDGNKPASQRKLTEGELKCKALLESQDVTYYIVSSVSEALDLLK